MQFNLFLVFKSCTEQFGTYISILCNKNVRMDSTYCEDNVRIPNETNKSLHDALAFEPVMILIIFFGAEKLFYSQLNFPRKQYHTPISNENRQNRSS